MRLYTALLAPVLCWGLAGCTGNSGAASPLPTTPVTLQGTLLLKGNAPRISPMLQTDDQGQWQLAGLTTEQMTQWQRQRVIVTGHGRNTQDNNALRAPVFEVTDIQPAR